MEKKYSKEGNSPQKINPFIDDFLQLEEEDENESPMAQSSSNITIDKFRNKMLGENQLKETSLENKIDQLSGKNIVKQRRSFIPSTKVLKLINIEKSLKETGIFGKPEEDNLIIRKMPEITEEQYNHLQNSIVTIDILTKLYNHLNSINCNFKSVNCGSSIGGLTPLTYLIESYYSLNKEMVQQMNEKYTLLKPYIYNYRTINGDGNCFYRAVIFRYLEILVLNKNIFILRKFVYNVVQSFNSDELTKRRIIQNNDIKPELTFKILFLIVDLLKNDMVKEAHQILVKSFSTCKKFDYAIILYFRYILYEYIKKNENKKYLDSFPVKIGNLLPKQFENNNGDFSFDLFYENYLLQFFTDAEKIIIYLTPFVLGIELDVIVFDLTGEDIIQKFKWEGESEIKTDEVISILNIRNHYQIIYTKKNNEKYKSLFEIYENKAKSIYLFEIHKYLTQKNEDKKTLEEDFNIFNKMNKRQEKKELDEKKSKTVINKINKNNQDNQNNKFNNNDLLNNNNLFNNNQDNNIITPNINNIDNNSKDNMINSENGNNCNLLDYNKVNINNNNYSNENKNNNLITNVKNNDINNNVGNKEKYINNYIQNNDITPNITNIDNNLINTKIKTSILPNKKKVENINSNVNENLNDHKEHKEGINYFGQNNQYINYNDSNKQIKMNLQNIFNPKTNIIKGNKIHKNENFNNNKEITKIYESNILNNINNKKLIVCDRCKNRFELNNIEIPLCEKCFKQRLFKSYINCFQDHSEPLKNIYMKFNSNKYYLDNLIEIYNKNFENKIDKNLIIKNNKIKECIFDEEHPKTKEKLPCGCKLCEHLIIYFENNFEFRTHFICKCSVEYDRPKMLELGYLFLDNPKIKGKIIYYFQQRLDKICCIDGEKISSKNNNQNIKKINIINKLEEAKLNKFLKDLIHKTCNKEHNSQKFKCFICNVIHYIKE